MKWLGPALVAALAVLAEVTLGRAAGGPDLAFFLGRFHPLVVHLPIGFFLLVALGEAATFHPKLRDRVEPALGLLVPLSALAAVAAFLMGQLLALEGGFPAGVLGWHRRLTLLAVLAIAGSWVLYVRQHENGGKGRGLYRGVMGAALGLLSLGAHFGGTMTRGETYLSKYAPAPLKPLLGTPEPKKEAVAEKPVAPTAEPLVYQDVVQPLLKQHCVECHGPDKQKGKLRLDSLEELLKGGESGAAIVAGAPNKSLIVQRMLLPLSDDDHMPPEKAGPKPEERALIEFWIERGAAPTLKVRDALAPAASRALLEHALGGAASDNVPVASGAGPADAPSVSTGAAADSAAPASDTAPSKAGQAAAAAGAASAHSGAGAVAAAAVGVTAPSSDGPSSSAGASPAGVTSGPAFLAKHCAKCHGPEKQKGKLRVDSVAALLQGGKGGPALVQGSPDKSTILQRVRLPLGDEDHMPPSKEPQPTAAEVQALASWIRAGAASAGGATPAKSGGGAAATAGASGVSAGAPASGVAATAAGPTMGASDANASGEPGSAAASVAPMPPPNAPALDLSEPADAAVLQKLPTKVALFSDAVQPLFREKCGKCHIKDKPAGGLNVAEHAQLLAGGWSGPGVVPKDRAASFVMQRLVLSPTDGDHMPPEDEPALSPEEIELVGAWIDAGAPANGATESARLTRGAARALAALGVKAAPEAKATVPPQSGGCAACSVPGAPRSELFGLQATALVALAAAGWTRRRRRGLTAGQDRHSVR